MLFQEKSPEYQKKNHIFNGITKTITLRSARNETICFQMNFKTDIHLSDIKVEFTEAPEIRSIFLKRYISRADMTKGKHRSRTR